jgi:hypothetical protein
MKRKIIRLPAKFVKHIHDGLYELRTQKTPTGEIAKALKIKEEYYEYKRNNDSGL